jgi:hypothetical protein
MTAFISSPAVGAEPTSGLWPATEAAAPEPGLALTNKRLPTVSTEKKRSIRDFFMATKAGFSERRFFIVAWLAVQSADWREK